MAKKLRVEHLFRIWFEEDYTDSNGYNDREVDLIANNVEDAIDKFTEWFKSKKRKNTSLRCILEVKYLAQLNKIRVR